jgi:DNA-binding GntR family transcriptional regulator
MARVTVRKALAHLEREGIIQRRQGAGTYLSSE